jgi:outer membrane protein
MKKTIVFILLTTIYSNILAQNSQKVGYTNPSFIYDQMLEKPFIDNILRSIKAQNDSILAMKVKEFQERYKILDEMSKKPNVDEVIYKDLERELTGKQTAIQEFQQNSQYVLLQKQQMLAAPVEAKIAKAINEVAKEMGYTHIFNTFIDSINLSILFFAKPEDDITDAVLKKLGLEEKKEESPEKK